MSETKSNLDPFIWNDVFPEPNELFEFVHKSLQEIFQSADIVLDTNVLLLPLSTGSKSLEEIRKIYNKLIAEDRLFIPAQVAREFAKNKPEKIKNLFHQVNQKRQINIKTSYSPLFEGIQEYDQIAEHEKTLLNQVQEYSKSISKMLDVIKDWGNNDPVSTMYREVGLGKRIIASNIDTQKLLQAKIRRYIHKLPPGYKDAGKDDEGVGDFIIWSEILALGATNRNDLIFVTGEEKADWWAKSSGMELLVRYELVDEYRRNSGGKSFHLINFFQLLELLKVESEIVDQAKFAQKEEEEYKEQDSESQEILDELPQVTNFLAFVRAAESAIRNWVKEQLSPYVDSINTENKYVDFTVHGSGAVIGFEVKGIRHVEHIARRVREVFTLGERFLADQPLGFSAFRAVFVTEDLDTAIKAMEYAKKLSFSNARYGVIIGHLDNEFNFKEIYRTYNDSYDYSLLLPF